MLDIGPREAALLFSGSQQDDFADAGAEDEREPRMRDIFKLGSKTQAVCLPRALRTLLPRRPFSFPLFCLHLL